MCVCVCVCVCVRERERERETDGQKGWAPKSERFDSSCSLTKVPCVSTALTKASDAVVAERIVSVRPRWYLRVPPLSYVGAFLEYILRQEKVTIQL